MKHQFGLFCFGLGSCAQSRARGDFESSGNSRNTDGTEYTEKTRISKKRCSLIRGRFGVIRDLRVLAVAVAVAFAVAFAVAVVEPYPIAFVIGINGSVVPSGMA